MRKKLCMLVSLLLILCSLPLYTVCAQEEAPAGFIEAARTDKLILYYRTDQPEIAVRNRTDGKCWYSRYPDSSVYGNAADTVKKRMDSLFVFDYVDMGGNSSKVNNLALEEAEYQVSADRTDAGFSYTITLTELNITIRLDFMLEGGSLKVSVPDESFLENADGLEKSQKAMADIQKTVDSLEKTLGKIRSSMSASSVGQAEYELFMLMFDACQQEIIKIRDNVKGEGIVLTAISNIRSNLDIVFTNLPDPTAYGGERKEIDRYLQSVSEQTDVVAKSATCLVSTLSLMPYFGSAAEDKDGYAFYPDGPGAISYFAEVLPDYIGYYDSPVYAEQGQDIDAANQNLVSGKQIANMPVFGIRSEASAFVAYIEKGDADARIAYYPRTNLLPLNAAYSTLIYRNFYTTMTSNAQKLNVLEKERIAGDRQITYTFLSGSEADYSGMARTYRQYLLDAGMLKKNAVGSDPRMAVDLLMGVRTKQFLFDRFLSMTSFEQAEDLLGDLHGLGITNADISLLGWNETGILRSPYATEPAKKLGGVRGIDMLTAAAQQMGYPLLLQIDPVTAQKGVSGFSPVKDVIKQKSSLVVTDASQKRYWFSPQKALKRLLSFLSPKREWLYRTSGLYLDNVGSHLYMDYAAEGIVSRQDTADIFGQMCGETAKELGGVIVGGPNVYMAEHAAAMRDVPTKDTGYFFTSETVPFLQMVYHGYVNYTDKPFNLQANAKTETLRAIEYGNMPYYKLTAEDSAKLRKTPYSALFSSKAADWYDDMQRIYGQYQEIFAGGWDSTMERHDKLSDGVYRTTYSDGRAVYVNYRGIDYEGDGFVIHPYSYYVSKEG